MNRKKYCYLMPDFPKEGFVMIPIFIVGTKFNIFPSNKIATNLTEVSNYMKDFVKETRKRFDDLEISENCAVFQIKFKSLFPLKRKYWENPHVEYGYIEKRHLFLELSMKPTVHELVVTPYSYDAKKNFWELSATLPIKLGTKYKTIDQFMLSSDAVVDERASHAAIYSVGEGLRVNWKNNKVEIVNVSPSPSKTLN